jgi:hypothetical protein
MIRAISKQTGNYSKEGGGVFVHLMVGEAVHMNDRSDLKIPRRDILRVLAFAAAAASTSGYRSAAAATNFPDKRKARYHADSPEVQTFYRVNRYPAK